jgi:ATP-dependent Lhr-like helicase
VSALATTAVTAPFIDAVNGHASPFPAPFHPATRAWFAEALGAPTPTQARGWAAIAGGAHTLIAAPTGSGKTLAAFLAAIDALVRGAESGPLPDATRVVYVSPLKALGHDVERNLAAPLAGIAAAAAAARGGAAAPARITTAVRTGDTSTAARARMVRRPPHILVTTPEGLYALVTSKGGRRMLGGVRTVIVDEIHALAPDRRGAHLALTLERLDALVGADGGPPVQRIGLSATQKPVAEVAAFLVGPGRACTVIDEGHARPRDLRIEVPDVALAAVLSTEGWAVVYDRVAALVRAHRTTLVFVNSRRLCERVAHQLAQRLGADRVAAHHGSLAPALRLDVEARLKAGALQVLVATASLELGLDIGDVDLVVQLGSVKRIAMFLQRVGRANHRHGGVPKGRLIPLMREELVEAVALLRCVERGELDRLAVPDHPLDVLAQQIVAACAVAPWACDALFALARRAHPYRALGRDDFDRVLAMLADGFPTERGRRGQLLHLDRVHGVVSARRGAGLTALASGGTIPDTGDYKVRLEPDGVVVGAVAEDFAIHQMPGHVIQLGSNSWRVLRVDAGEVRVEAAAGEAPYMPVWFGELPARSDELSAEVSRLRAEVAAAPSAAAAAARLAAAPWLDRDGAEQLADYLVAGRDALGAMPSAACVVAERFLDLAGGSQLVVHAPVGVRVTRAWALALRHVLGTRHGVEVQAAATDDGFLLSLPGTVSFPLGEMFALVGAAEVEALVAAATLEVPMFMVRWRWAASRALLVPRVRGGRRVPPHLQRTDADELLLTALPGPGGVPGRSWRVEAKQGGARSARLGHESGQTLGAVALSDQPLLRQTLADCLHEAMDVRGLAALLDAIERGEVAARAVERLAPSPAAFGMLTAKPPAFLDSGALMDRRTRNVESGPGRTLRHQRLEAETAVHPEAVARVAREVAPDLRSAEDLAAHLALAGVVTDDELPANAQEGDEPPGGSPDATAGVRAWLAELEAAGRALRFRAENGRALWAAVERLPELAAAFPQLAALSEARGTAPAALAPAAALAQVLRGRLETSGPVTATDVAAALGVPPALADDALARLGADGFALCGAYDPRRPGEPAWCERRVLARIERLTRNKLRAEIEPLSAQEYYRFLLRWHGLTPGDRRGGRDGLAHVLAMLDGLELPAAAWEESVLSARTEGYDLDLLDELCLSGEFGWGRLTPAGPVTAAAERRAGLTRATPVALYRTAHVETWRALAAPAAEAPAGPALSAHAEAIRAALAARGASFLGRLERALGLPRAHFELGLMELVAAGVLTADSYAGLRGLLAKPSKWGVPRLDRLASANTGRWSLLPAPGPAADPVAREAAVETYARALLRRYGVVVRPVVQREAAAAAGVRWLDLLRVLRRLEARGEVRGGYFVRDAGGEHFALPEALPLLREVRARAPAGELVSVSAADPLNLTGTLAPGPRVPARTTARVLLADAVPIAVLDGRRVAPLGGAADLTADQLRVLRASPAPAALAIYA